MHGKSNNTGVLSAIYSICNDPYYYYSIIIEIFSGSKSLDSNSVAQVDQLTTYLTV